MGSIDDYVIRYWYKPEGPRHAAVRGAGNAGFTSVFYYDALQRPIAHYNPYVNIGLGYNPAVPILPRPPSRDMTVYRLYGGAAGPLGRSWTTVDPRTMRDPRDSLGLPNTNTATDLMIGRLRSQAGVDYFPARPLDGNQGGAPEVRVPHPVMQIQLIHSEPFQEPD